jgi:cytochrome c oxidase assembly factor CtaG
MDPATVPLTWSTSLTSWRWDSAAALLIAGGCVAYVWARRRATRRSEPVTPGPVWCFALGEALSIAATMSFIGVYDQLLFWVRALQVLLLLFVVPFFLAMSRPVTLLRGALGSAGRARLDRSLATPAARFVAHPTTTSVAMLGTPWLLYLTPWYVAALKHSEVAAATRMLLVLVGFGYFYARLQTDPVPRRYSQLISLVISIVESIGDGLLGIVLWLGPLIAVDYYTHVGRHWGPSLRVDQSIGAGILWIVGDVLGVPFIVVLMRLFSADEKVNSDVVDAQLDNVSADFGATSALWWENDPQLRDRMGRR